MKIEKKQLNLFNVFCLGLGGAIGSGIFVMMGEGIGYTGHSVVLTVSLGCVYMLLAYFFHLILSSMFVMVGGDYDARAMLFSPLMTGVYAMFIILNNFGMAAYATSTVDYVSMVFPKVNNYKTILAVLLITLLFAATIRGSKFVASLMSVMTVVMVVSIALFCAFGIGKVQPGFFDRDTFFLNGGSGFLMSIAIMSFACMGTTMAPFSQMAVTKNARKTTPIAILLVTIALAVIYAVTGYVASGVLPVEQVAGKNLALVAAEIFPNWLCIMFILGGAAFAIITSMTGGIIGMRYPMIRVADDGWIPEIFKKTTKNGYPYVTMLVIYIISIIPLILGFSLDEIISLIMIPNTLINCYMNLCLRKVVRRFPKAWEKSILHMPLPIFDILCIIAGLCNIVVAVSLMTSLTLLSGTLAIVLLLSCFGLSYLRLKTGAVDREKLLQNKEDMFKKYEKEENNEASA